MGGKNSDANSATGHWYSIDDWELQVSMVLGDERNVQIIPQLQLKHQFPALFLLFLPSHPYCHPIHRQRRGWRPRPVWLLRRDPVEGLGASLLWPARQGRNDHRQVSPKEVGLSALCIVEAVEGHTASFLPPPDCGEHSLAPGF